jgi:hypothetical protein
VKTKSHPDLWILILLSLFLLIGLLVVTDYGESWDEQARYEYAKHSLVEYEGKSRVLTDEKGPFFNMYALLGARVITSFSKAWRQIDALHFITYLTYLMGLFFFYRFCKRLIKSGPALAATLLFGTQPLLWGHAFMNPKDIPFMVFFLGSTTLGLEMVDSFMVQSNKFLKEKRNASLRYLKDTILLDWKNASSTQHGLFIVSGIILIFLLVGRNLILGSIDNIIRQAYMATSPGWLVNMFDRIAQNADQIPVADYLLKWHVFYNRLALPTIIILSLINLFLINKIFVTSIEIIFHGKIASKTILAGIFLGFCSAIRALGPASGLLVILYFLLKSGKKAITTILLYLCIGGVVTYLAWPGLWGNPIVNYFNAIRQSSDFPWSDFVTFNGQQYFADNLPKIYLPKLISIQFTETALILILSGIVLSVIEGFNDSRKRLDILIIATWFLAPILQIFVFDTTLYDNFRQLLFIIPPLFVFSCFSFEKLFDLIKNKLIFTTIVVLTLIPGIYWIIQLHPYEYVYYNNLVGGTKGAFRNYEMDYWATSYKEAIEYLNQTAPENSLVVVRAPSHAALTYARPDLKIQEYHQSSLPKTSSYFFITTSRHNEDLTFYPEISPLFTISRVGATFAVVKQITPQNSTTP